jgi:RNA polymerase sigma factor (sigma-70 family)
MKMHIINQRCRSPPSTVINSTKMIMEGRKIMKEYYIRLIKSNIEVKVSEEIYRAYKRPQWREAKITKSEQKRIVSLNDFIEEPNQKSIEDIIIDKILFEKAFENLTDEEKTLINQIYFQEKSEREIAKEQGLSNKTINKRHHKILEKMRKVLKI